MSDVKGVADELAGAFQQTRTPRVQQQAPDQNPNPPPPPEPPVKRVDQSSPHPHRGQNLNTTV